MNKTFDIWERQDKAAPLIAALQKHGWVKHVPRPGSMPEFPPEPLGLLLIDYEHPNRNHILEHCDRVGTKIMVYPHSARTPYLWDGLYAPWPSTVCNFVFGPGQKQVLQTYGYPHPVETMGWHYCGVKPFTPTRGIEVLYAPTHPNPVKFTIPDAYYKANEAVFRILLAMVPRINLRVRYGRDMRENGIWYDSRVEYELASYSLASSLKSIEPADLVVARDTFGYLAVACGKPTVMFAERVTGQDPYHTARTWERYVDLLAFPLDLTAAQNPDDMLAAACESDERIATWRAGFIGQQFDPDGWVLRVEQLLGA